MRGATLAALWLAAAPLAACDSPSEIRIYDRAALDIARRVAPEAEFEVVDSRSNMMRDSGRTVYLRYSDGTDTFQVLVSMQEPGRCDAMDGPDCEASLHRQITLGREGGVARRRLAPALAACPAPEERPVIGIASQRGDMSDRNVRVAATFADAVRPAETDPLALAEACDRAVRALHATGPFGDLPLSTTFTVTLDLPERAANPASGEDPTVRYAVRTYEDASSVSVEATEFDGPLDAQNAFERRLQAAADAAFARAGLPLRANVYKMPSTLPLNDDRARVAVHMIAYPVEAGPDEPARWNDVVRLIYDMGDGTITARCVIENVRRADRLIDTERVEGPCSIPLD